jgi:hypothetical protein
MTLWAVDEAVAAGVEVAIAGGGGEDGAAASMMSVRVGSALKFRLLSSGSLARRCRFYYNSGNPKRGVRMLTTVAGVLLGGIPLMLFAIGYIGAMQAKSGSAVIESIWLMLAGILLGGALLALALWRPAFVPAVFF